MTTAISVIGASVTHRLNEVTFEVLPGTVTAVIGANGSGKSSLLHAIAGELHLDAGSVELLGVNVATASTMQLARVRAVLSQETQVNFGFTVSDVVSWGRTPWRGTNQASDDEEAIAAAIADQGLLGVEHRRVVELSGGERKRVHIARVLCQRTPILLLDEADGDLDLAGRAHLDAVVRQLANHGITIVLVSHDLARVAQVADTVIALKRGRVLSQGTADDVITSGVLTDLFDTPCTVERTERGYLMIATS